jgi:NAD(P)-dependent dehydrogenase (short-subunit alcohol dehydrogenase family)
MNSFANQVVLITGAASGIGRQLALNLSAEGAHIAGLDLQREPLEALRSLLKSPCATVVADVIDLAALRAAVKQLETQLGPADILIANAGIGRETPAAHFSPEDIGAQIQVNLVGVVNSIAAVLPAMRQRGRGHLVAISSLASYRGLPLMAGYCASKAGVNALMDALRVELRPLGIHVTTICPGWIRTPLTASIKLPTLNMMDVEVAVARMVKAIRSRRSFVAFPPRDAWQVRLLRYLPRSLSDWLVKRFLARMRK